MCCGADAVVASESTCYILQQLQTLDIIIVHMRMRREGEGGREGWQETDETYLGRRV